MKREDSELTPEQRAELQAPAALPEEQGDTTDIPELHDWSDAGRGSQPDISRALREQVERRVQEMTP